MHNGFVHSTGNNFLNPIAVSTWAPDFSFWGVNFDPSNPAAWLGLADYAYVTLRNTFGTNPLSRLTAQQVGSAAAKQTAALGTRGVDLTMLQNRLLSGSAQRTIPSGSLIRQLGQSFLPGVGIDLRMVDEAMGRESQPTLLETWTQQLAQNLPNVPQTIANLPSLSETLQFYGLKKQEPVTTTVMNGGPRNRRMVGGGSGARRL